MQRSLSCLLATTFVAVAASAGAQTSVAPPPAGQAAAAPTRLRLTVVDAVNLALDHNVDLRADRLDPQISDTRVAAATGLFLPTFTSSVQQNSQVQPPTSFLIPTAQNTDAVTS